MKYVLAVLVLVAIWLPTAVLTFKAITTQKFYDQTPGFANTLNDHATLAWVIGAFSLLATIFLLIGQIQNNWL